MNNKGKIFLGIFLLLGIFTAIRVYFSLNPYFPKNLYGEGLTIISEKNIPCFPADVFCMIGKNTNALFGIAGLNDVIAGENFNVQYSCYGEFCTDYVLEEINECTFSVTNLELPHTWYDSSWEWSGMGRYFAVITATTENLGQIEFLWDVKCLGTTMDSGSKTITATTGCSDECTGDYCSGSNRIVCADWDSDGCLEPNNQGPTIGYCGVECLSGSDCGVNEECYSYSCESSCISEDYSSCYNGDVYWYDSCGTRENMKTHCASYCMGDVWYENTGCSGSSCTYNSHTCSASETCVASSGCEPSFSCTVNCPDGWTCYLDSCYLDGNSYSWVNARDFCAGQGGSLVTINNQDENDWLASNYNSFAFWIGINDRDSEGVWEWDGADSSFTHWGTGEPNNAGGEDCTQMPYSGSHWNDISCTNLYKPVCEYLFCSNTCTSDSCSGNSFIECFDNDGDGCNEPINQGPTLNKCGVECLVNADCNSNYGCESYTCVLTEVNGEVEILW